MAWRKRRFDIPILMRSWLRAHRRKACSKDRPHETHFLMNMIRKITMTMPPATHSTAVFQKSLLFWLS